MAAFSLPSATTPLPREPKSKPASARAHVLLPPIYLFSVSLLLHPNRMKVCREANSIKLLLNMVQYSEVNFTPRLLYVSSASCVLVWKIGTLHDATSRDVQRRINQPHTSSCMAFSLYLRQLDTPNHHFPNP
jgi:hypothetical protein